LLRWTFDDVKVCGRLAQSLISGGVSSLEAP
jgi:hypothetical protein